MTPQAVTVSRGLCANCHSTANHDRPAVDAGKSAAPRPLQAPDRQFAEERRSRGRGASDANLRVPVRDPPGRSWAQCMARLVVGRSGVGAAHGRRSWCCAARARGLRWPPAKTCAIARGRRSKAAASRSARVGIVPPKLRQRDWRRTTETSVAPTLEPRSAQT